MSFLQAEVNRNSYRPETPQNDTSIYATENYSRSPLATNHFEADDEIENSEGREQSESRGEGPAGRSVSTSSARVDGSGAVLGKNGTLKKKASIKPPTNLSRRSSRRSLRNASITAPTDRPDEGFNNVFRVPIPTTGNPTEVLANRFQAWRKFLKDLIGYFREIQASYENRAKALVKVSGALQSMISPREFVSEGGISDALGILRGYSKVSVTESNRARDIEEDVITQLNGLRNDLNNKMKEIKSLSGDFKNSVDKEKENTRRAVDHFRESLAMSQSNPTSASGKSDPFIARLAVERQVEKQIDEENYLHRAYLNLEGSGRELEAIVVGEIQKAFNAYAGILKREYDHAHEAVDLLRTGPIAMPKDHEWESFVHGNPNFINPNLPLRKLENIFYPGKFAPAAVEIRGGTLERKSKYLKSYTPGWYILSATHIHEFKSADHLHSQTPVMSLCLAEQKLGSHSQPGASSHKFNLKGRQTGSMHRGHSWVFRAESYDTMMAWYEDIKALIEKTGEDKVAFMRKHVRITSASTYGGTSVMSADGLGDDEADRVPFGGTTTVPPTIMESPPQERPEQDSQFGTGLNPERNLQPPQFAASAASSVYGPRDSMALGEGSSALQSQQNLGIPRHEAFEAQRHSSGDTPSRLSIGQGAYGTPTRQSYEEHVEHPRITSAKYVSSANPYGPTTYPNSVYQTPHPFDQGSSRQYAMPMPPQSTVYQNQTPYGAAPQPYHPYQPRTFIGPEAPTHYASVASLPQTAHETDSSYGVTQQPIRVQQIPASIERDAPHQNESAALIDESEHGTHMPALTATQDSTRHTIPPADGEVPQIHHEFSHERVPDNAHPNVAAETTQRLYESNISNTTSHHDASRPEAPSGLLEPGTYHEFSHEPAPHEMASTIVPIPLAEPLNYNPSQSESTAEQNVSHELPTSRSPPSQSNNPGPYLNGARDSYHGEVGPTETAPGVFVNTQTQDFSNHKREQNQHPLPKHEEPAPRANQIWIQPSSSYNGDAFPPMSEMTRSNDVPDQSAASVSSTSDTDATSVVHLLPTPATEVYVGAPNMEPMSDAEKERGDSTTQTEHSTQTPDFVGEPNTRVSRFTEVGMAGLQTGRWNGGITRNVEPSATSSPPPFPLTHSDTAATLKTISDLPMPGKYMSRG